MSSKVVDYLVCGTPVVSEIPAPNNFRIKELNAGSLCEWNNFNSLYKKIQEEKKIKRDKTKIRVDSRNIFNPMKACEYIIKVVSR